MAGHSVIDLPTLIAPHTGEYLYSLMNRMWRRSGAPSSSDFSGGFVPKSKSDIFHRRAPAGVAEVAHLTGLSAIELLEYHTAVPYWESTMQIPLSREDSARFFIGKHANSRYGISAWKRFPLQFCVECAREDETQFHEAIWRTQHQLPGVLVCLKHKQWLSRQCTQCGWMPRCTTFLYPPALCPSGHAFKPKRPIGSMSLANELAFADLSQELNAYQLGARQHSLRSALKDIAIEMGLSRWNVQFPFDAAVERLLHRNRNGLLKYYPLICHRISNHPIQHPLTPALGRTLPLSPHPMKVAICIKAMMGPKQCVLTALSQHKPVPKMHPANDDWAGIWSALEGTPAKERIPTLRRFFDARACEIPASSYTGLQLGLGRELGLSRESIKLYLTRFPALDRHLKRLRKDINWPH